MPDMIEKYSVPRVGLGVMVWKDGRILLGKRKSEMGDGEWCMPGGHLEKDESIIEGIKRETREEAGIEIENVRFVVVSNSLAFAPRHYVMIGFQADLKLGEEPRTDASEKIGEWGWFSPDNVPSQLFLPSARLLEAYQRNETFIDDPAM